MITRYLALHNLRKEKYEELQNQILSFINPAIWNEYFSNAEYLAKLILACTNFKYVFKDDKQLSKIVKKTTEMCYKLHVRRTWLMNK